MRHRLQRCNELIRRELGALIDRELSFDGAIVTIHQVDLSPDLRQAHVYLAAIGADVDRHAILTRLAQNRSQLQHALSRRVILKYTPVLQFHYDDSFERGARVIRILDEIGEAQPPANPPAQ